MKNLLAVLCTFIFFQMTLQAQGSRIGVVDANRIIEQSIKGKAFFKEYENFKKQKEKEINALINDYQNYQKDIQAKAASMSVEAREEAEMKLERKQIDLKRKQEDAQRESQLKLNEKLEEFQRELSPLIRQVAIEMELDLVLNLNAQSDIIYTSQRTDITNEVIKKYDKMNR